MYLQEPNLNFSCGERRISDLLKMWNARYQIPNYKPFREITELWLVTEVYEYFILDSLRAVQQTKPAEI